MMGIFLGEKRSYFSLDNNRSDGAPVNKHWVCSQNVFFCWSRVMRIDYCWWHIKGARRKEGKNKVAALTEVQLTVSNYRRADSFCTVNRTRRSLGIFTPLLGDFSWQHSFWSSANSTQRRGVCGRAVGGCESGPRWLPSDDSELLSHSWMLVTVWSHNCTRNYRNISRKLKNCFCDRVFGK